MTYFRIEKNETTLFCTQEVEGDKNRVDFEIEANGSTVKLSHEGAREMIASLRMALEAIQ